ncbi:substrate-binding domain-containing protein [Amycolatopsis saalfeldensis]|uniref:Phosphate ABC transporter substrate-binding protein, PhoT family n=1 Tax=Amycolatopsis saalfeldensis TaxID=394193 RepID=A0A1H8VXQ8_9PSEU|nr:substrate-binding domain-containing protein [Amycolatopsis saalfeldensis]SEP20186.1 phosphate ABC transporter substrate-binding protein, PhoT family [Amycolatopsis saalfeldensis]
MRARTARFVGITAAVAAGAALLIPGTANAVPGPNGIPEVVAAVGSDTIADVTGAIFAAANADSATNTDPDNYVTVPPVLAPNTSFVVPGDAFDGGTTYTNPGNLPPNGSSAGKTALDTAAAAGSASIDIARSSSGPSSSDPSTFRYYGFGKDGVSWAASSTGSGAGVTLTLQQLRDIYSGVITNWSAVGGANAPITVYLPQAGSGTLAFFTGTVLGFDPTTKPVTIKRMQENEGDTIPAADQATAIAPYSVAQFVAQGNGAVTDKRAGFFEGTLTDAGSDGAPVSGTAPNLVPAFADGFLGARTVYFVLDTRSPSFDAALNVVGFDAAGPSKLCSGSLSATLTKFGFKPLAADANGVTCTLG